LNQRPALFDRRLNAANHQTEKPYKLLFVPMAVEKEFLATKPLKDAAFQVCVHLLVIIFILLI